MDTPLRLHLSILFRSEKNRKIAIDFLNMVKDRSRQGKPYTSVEWKTYCEQNKIPQAAFYVTTKKLKRYGLVVKTGGHHNGEYHLGLIEALCKKLEAEWLDFLK